MRTVALAAALVTLTASAAAAQRQPAASPQALQAAQTAAPARPRQAPPFGPGARGGLALFLSTNPPALNLTRDQLTRIQAAHERTQQANAALREQIRTAVANRDPATFSLAERHALMVRVRNLREQMLDNVDSATTVAIATLNAEQQRTIQAMHQLRGGMRRGMMGGRGMRGGMMGGRGMRPGMGRMGGMGGMMQGGPMQGRMGPGMMQGGMMPAMAPAAGAQPTQRPPQ